MSDKSDLKAELERKKQRLAQIREEKKRKEEERKKKEVRKNVSTAAQQVFQCCFRHRDLTHVARVEADPCLTVCVEQSDNQKKRETTPEDSDLDRKRRETEALLQSIGISPEPSLGS